MNRMDGQLVAERLKGELASRIDALKGRDVTPTLAILVVGDDERTAAYVRAKQRAADQLGIQVQITRLGADQPTEVLVEQVRSTIEQWNNRTMVHGIVLQLPLPDGIDEQALIDEIDPRKDVDGLTATNQAALEAGRELIPPATPMGILRLLTAYDVPIAGTRVAIIGQGRLVGEPLAAMLKARDADVVTADTSTPDLRTVTKGATIVIVATGEPELIDADLIDSGTVLIDVGLSERHGRLIGDTTAEAKAKARLATPVPGGVGPMTVVSLLANVVLAAEIHSLT